MYLNHMKDKKTLPFHFSKSDIKRFISEYITEYRRLVEKSYPELKKLFPLYVNYPYRIVAYVSPRKTLLEYQPKVPNFAVNIKLVEELPKIDIKTKRYIAAFRNDYLIKIITKPKESAKQDVLRIIADYETYEESQKELAEYYERQYAEYVDDYVTYTLERYASYVESAYDVKKETLSKQRNEIYDIVKIVDNLRGYLIEALLKSDCSALFMVFDEATQDIESSLFLAMHGRYVPANALLRRIMEMVLTALYFDDEIRKCKKGSRSHNDLCHKRDAWIQKSSRGSLSFTGEYGVLGRLIDPDTDYFAKKIMETNRQILKKTFKAYVRKLYSDLCRFVHYGGLGLTDRFSLEFAVFEERIFKEWISRFRQVFEACNILLVVKFPEVLEAYEKLESDLEPFEQVQLLTLEQHRKLMALNKEEAQ